MTQLTDPAPVKLGRKRDLSRDPEILEAALEVLAETGYDGMTIDMVATRAKAGKATLYRRWASKAELVIDAVACMKQVDLSPEAIPDTGTLRGDLIAMIKPHAMLDAERKLRVMAGLMSLIASNPEFAETAHDAIVAPRTALNRFFLQRAKDRGEIAADVDIEMVASISQSMVSFRTLMLRKPADRDYLISVIDEVVLPAAGIRA